MSVKNVVVGDRKITTPYKIFSNQGTDGIVEISATFSNDLLEKAYRGKSSLDSLPKKCNPRSTNIILPSFTDAKISEK